MSAEFNPIKQFQWTIELDGVDQFECQKVDIPEVSLGETVHNGDGFKPKTPNGINVSDMVLHSIRQTGFTENKMWDWLFTCYDPDTGGSTQEYSDYAKIGFLKLWNPDFKTCIHKYQFKAWPKKISSNSFDKSASENIIEKVTFSTIEYKPLY